MCYGIPCQPAHTHMLETGCSCCCGRRNKVASASAQAAGPPVAALRCVTWLRSACVCSAGH